MIHLFIFGVVSFFIIECKNRFATTQRAKLFFLVLQGFNLILAGWICFNHDRLRLAKAEKQKKHIVFRCIKESREHRSGVYYLSKQTCPVDTMDCPIK
jgi:hypothetical protein